MTKVYHFRDGEKYISIKANNEKEAWEKLSQQYGYNNMDNFYNDINSDFGLHDPELLNEDVDPIEHKNSIKYAPNKESCEFIGGTWIKGYIKHIRGKIIKVDGYCRDRLERRYYKS